MTTSHTVAPFLLSSLPFPFLLSSLLSLFLSSLLSLFLSSLPFPFLLSSLPFPFLLSSLPSLFLLSSLLSLFLSSLPFPFLLSSLLSLFSLPLAGVGYTGLPGVWSSSCHARDSYKTWWGPAEHKAASTEHSDRGRRGGGYVLGEELSD